MLRALPGFLFAAVAGLGGSLPALAQPPAPPPVPPAAAPAPPPIVDLTPVDLPERSRCNNGACTPIDCVTCSGRPPAFLTTAEYLVVRPRRRANDFAIIDPTDNLTPQGEILNVPYDTVGAFRIGAGYRPGGSAWEAMATYTYLHSGEDREAAAPRGGVLYATLTRPGLVDNVNFAVGSSSMTLHVVDGDTMRHFQIDESFSFKLGFGARYADLDQALSATYLGRDANFATVRSRTCFNGFGVSVGGQGDWVFWRGLRLFGRAKASLLMGDFTNSLTETDNGGRTVNANVSEDFLQTVPVLELASGIAWEHRNMRIALGYELQNWFNVIDSPTFVNDFAEGKLGRRKSDLGLEGVFLQLGLAF